MIEGEKSQQTKQLLSNFVTGKIKNAIKYSV